MGSTKRSKKDAQGKSKPRRKTSPKTGRRGAPPGNQNARAGGLFSTLFTDAELADLATAPDTLTVDDILPLLLVRIRRALAEGASLDTVARGVDTYLRALKTKKALEADKEQTLEAAFEAALQEIADEMGLPV